MWIKFLSLNIFFPLLTDTRPLDNTYEFTDQNSFLKERPVSATMSDKSLFDELDKHLAMLDLLCPEDKSNVFQVCFYSNDADENDPTKVQKCLIIGAQDLNGSQLVSIPLHCMVLYLQVLWLIMLV